MLEKTPLQMSAPDWGLLNEAEETDMGYRHQAMEMLQEKNRALVNSLQDAKVVVEAFQNREEMYAAQAVMQDMTLSKMNWALHVKEEKGKNKPDKEVLPNKGLGRLWTDERILGFQQRKKTAQAQEEVDKKARLVERESKKEKKGALEKEWKEIKVKHAEWVEAWSKTCEQHWANGTRVRDLPRKPTHISKKDLAARFMGSGQQDNNDGGSDSNEDEGTSE